MSYLKKIVPFVCALACSGYLPAEAHAIRLKIRQTGGDQNKVVAASTENAGFSEKTRGVVKFSGKRAQLAVLTDDGPQSVVLAYKKGKKIFSARKILANPDTFCADGDIQAYTSLKGKRLNVKVATRDEADIAYYSGKLGSEKGLKKSNLKDLVDVDTDCLPAGNGLTLGLGDNDSPTDINIKAKALETDQDSDGLLDLFDTDIDDDGILNNYDLTSTFPTLFPNFSVFSNLKVSIADTVNVSAFGREPTKTEVDALTAQTILAVEVKAGSGEESELNCGSLSYCSAGGTGQTGNPAVDFPGTAGGSLDSDSDGNGTIAAGSTGDFQLATNLSAFNELNAGDSYIQTVTPSSSGLIKLYFSSLQFAFRSTPAAKSITLDPDGTPAVTNFTYPVADGSTGTPSNCLSVTPNGDGDVILEYEAWRPQRAGVAALGEASFVDLGNSLITIDIPNAPAPNGSTPTAGPGNCPASAYTTSDTNLSTDSAGLVDSFGDTDAAVANTVTFQIDITACLASAGQTLDSGDELSVDLQFRNDVGDNAAQKICIERP